MYKDCPRAERIKIFTLTVDPYIIMYSNEAESANQVIYDDYKVKRNFHGSYKNIAAL